MTTRLEEQLVAELHEYAADISPTRDIVAAAARRHRRRVLLTRAMTATGGTGLAAGVAVAIGISAGSPDGDGHPAPGAQPTALSVEYVSAKVEHALADADHKIQYGQIRLSQGGRVARSEFWRDGTNGTLRRKGISAPGEGRTESSITFRGGRATFTMVDYRGHAWWTFVRQGTAGSGQIPTTPAAIKASLKGGGHAFAIAGKDQLHGRLTLHLRLSGGQAPAKSEGGYDLWVDARTYEPVRLVVVKKGTEVVHLQEDYEWLPRTPRVLSMLKVVPPGGFKHLAGPPAPRPIGN
jgi:hypothetical protein